MQKLIAALLIFSVAVAGCKKDPPSPTTPPDVDTLMGWQKVNPGQTGFSDVWFTTKQQGCLLTTNGIFRTADEGTSWTKVANGTYSDFYFLNSQYGYAMGNGFAYTTNGGLTWVELSNVLQNYGPQTDLFFTSPSTGYVVAALGLYKTTDTGKTWQLARSGSPTGIYFTNASNGWLFEEGKLYNTTNAGTSWQQKFDLQRKGDISQIVFTDAQHGRFVSEKLFGRSDDGGISWTTREFKENLYDIYFADNNTGYITSYYNIYKTTDGGNTWNRVCHVAQAPLVELNFVDANNGWACGSNNTLLHWKQ